MIGEFLLNIVFTIVNGFFMALPSFSWDIDSSALTAFLDVLKVAVYLFPVNSVLLLLSLYASLQTFKITVSLVKTIWAILPLV